MKSIIIAAIAGIATQLPSIIAEFQKTIKDAESDADVKDKIKSLLEDVAKLLQILDEVL